MEKPFVENDSVTQGFSFARSAAPSTSTSQMPSVSARRATQAVQVDTFNNAPVLNVSLNENQPCSVDPQASSVMTGRRLW